MSVVFPHRVFCSRRSRFQEKKSLEEGKNTAVEEGMSDDGKKPLNSQHSRFLWRNGEEELLHSDDLHR